MTGFNAAERAACAHLIELALTEDLGPDWVNGDVTCTSLIPPDREGCACLIYRVPGILAGLPAATMVLAAVDPKLKGRWIFSEGERVGADFAVGYITGPFASLLKAERTLLNFIQHLSGIATVTRRYVDAVKGLQVQILDTRKTLPAYRLLEKYAVRQGGGHNHRVGLFDSFLIKDNHLAARRDLSLPQVVAQARAANGQIPLEIEVENLEQLEAVLPARPDIVLLDNMPPDLLRLAVQRRNALAPAVRLEASGGITLQTVRAVAETGVDRISVGALTHSAPALDIALEALP